MIALLYSKWTLFFCLLFYTDLSLFFTHSHYIFEKVHFYLWIEDVDVVCTLLNNLTGELTKNKRKKIERRECIAISKQYQIWSDWNQFLRIKTKSVKILLSIEIWTFARSNLAFWSDVFSCECLKYPLQILVSRTKKIIYFICLLHTINAASKHIMKF